MYIKKLPARHRAGSFCIDGCFLMSEVTAVAVCDVRNQSKEFSMIFAASLSAACITDSSGQRFFAVL